jgi:hypothetical protein
LWCWEGSGHEDAYEQLINQHLDHAEKTFASRCALGAA